MNSRLSNDNEYSRHELSMAIKTEAQSLGFFACGIAKAAPVDEATAAHLHKWLEDGGNADMEYMAGYTDKRLDPRLLMNGLKSIVSVALNYTPAQSMPKEEFQFAAYALGKDYHDIVKSKLRQLAAHFGFQDELHLSDDATDDAPRCRIFVDSGPVLERYWAEQAGLGWTGKNHQLIIPRAGSMFFLGELFLDVELEYDTRQKLRCGNCHKCIDACPTGALCENKEIEAEKCLSYQLIENRGELSNEAKEKMGNTIYGCDRCQQACPWNRYATPNTTPELQPSLQLLQMKRQDWEKLTIEQYRQLFKGSAVKRAKYEGLMRNIRGKGED